jgi:tungstate transport system permease protein
MTECCGLAEKVADFAFSVAAFGLNCDHRSFHRKRPKSHLAIERSLDRTRDLARQNASEMPGDTSAFHLIVTGDPALLAIVRLSLIVSLSAVLFAALIGTPFGALVALTRFAGRETVIIVLNALMGLPPVVVGLAVFLILSRSGPLGALGLLFTPQAMVIAQTIIIAPIIAALTRQTIEDLWFEYRDELAAMNIGPMGRVATLIWDARFSLVTVLLAGFGRAAAEVGAIIIVGGNIDGFTRTMTTAIALETSKGDLSLAIGLGMVLIAIVVLINALAWGASRFGRRYAG